MYMVIASQKEEDYTALINLMFQCKSTHNNVIMWLYVIYPYAGSLLMEKKLCTFFEGYVEVQVCILIIIVIIIIICCI